MSATDTFFALVALAAAACFGALIALQVLEWKYYEDPQQAGGNVWPVGIIALANNSSR